MICIPEDLMEQLTLFHRKQGYLIGKVGITLNLYYEQPMFELVDVFRAATDAYLNFVPRNSINFYNNHEYWRAFKPRSIGRLLNRFSSRDERGYWLDLAQIAYEEDADGPYPIDELGEYGLYLGGCVWDRCGASRDTGVCAIRCEFPADELLRSTPEAFLAFTETLASLAPFDSGHGGYTFKYSHRSDENQEHAWISHKAPRFLAIHPQTDNFEYYTRHYIANVNWLTLLGRGISDKLGGSSKMRANLSEAVEVHSLLHGTMLVAGESPPIGDVNQQAPDLGPLREVARLTRPLWIDETVLSNRILNSFWGEPDDSERWINRFELTF